MQPITKIWIEISEGETSQQFDVLNLLLRIGNVLERLENHPAFKGEGVQNQNEESLLNTTELAESLKKSESSIHNWKRQGLIPYERIGRSVYYRKADVLDALKKIPAITQRQEKKFNPP